MTNNIKEKPFLVPSPHPCKSTFFKICWWNGGGNIKQRLNTNPELRKFLSKKPDIFVYGETCSPSSLGLSINGYSLYLHKAKLNVEGNYRRGLAVFYRSNYRFLLTKVYSSNIYDIVWFRFSSFKELLHFCFFYAPGSHHPLPARTKFYEIFSSTYTKFASLGKVFLVGDTNARLGCLLDDRNVRGAFITNSNQPLFIDFLQYSGLEILNTVFCKGVPTYEIVGKKRSIIDLGLTNSIESVQNFEIETTPFGVNSQTCHRAITIAVNTRPPRIAPIKAPRRTKGPKLTSEECIDLGKIVSEQILAYEGVKSPDYFLLVETFKQNKKKLSLNRHGKPQSTPASPALQLIQLKFSEAIARMQKEKTDFSIFAVDNIEKLLKTQYLHEEERRFTQWLRKLNTLDFKNRTRAFFLELRKKHNATQTAGPIVDCLGKLSNTFDKTLKNWAEYYKKLYFLAEPVTKFQTPDSNAILDRDLELSEFLDAYYSLKPHKSPGYHGITSMDYHSLLPLEVPNEDPATKAKLASLKFIFNILRDFWFNESVPRDFKRTILRPFLKNEDSNQNDPVNYRPISLLNSLMKIYEGTIHSRLTIFLEENDILSPYQSAYRKDRSIFDHFMVLHELFLEYRFFKVGPRGGKRKCPLYFCFLDLKKAFDTVIRNILFRKLWDVGIRGKILRVIVNLFSDNPANVLLDGFLSPEFTIKRGVLQGSKLGPTLFSLFVNDLLFDLNQSNLGASVGPVHIAALGFADDIVLISDKPWKLQQLLNLCQDWADKNGMAFKTSKCKVMIFNKPGKHDEFTLDKTVLKIVSTFRYLGVVLTSNYVTNLFKCHFQAMMLKAKTRAAAIRCLGFSKNGFRVKSLVKLYKLQVRPLLDFGAQSLAYLPYSLPLLPDAVRGFAKMLEHHQTQMLKSLINCPRATCPAIVRLFCGTEPLVCRLDILKLRYYWRMLHGPTDAPCYKILQHRKNRFLDCSKGFARDVFNICIKYNLMPIWHGVAPPGRSNRRLNPLHYIRKVVISHHLRDDLEVGRTRNCSFSKIYLADPFVYQKSYHIVKPFTQENCFTSRKGRKHFIKALLHPASYSENCPLCLEENTDMCEHLLTTCPRIPDFRKKLHLKLTLYNYPVENHLVSKLGIIKNSLINKAWRKCFTEFLADVDY